MMQKHRKEAERRILGAKAENEWGAGLGCGKTGSSDTFTRQQLLPSYCRCRLVALLRRLAGYDPRGAI